MKKFMFIYFPLLIIIGFSLLSIYQYDKIYFIKQLIWILIGFIIIFSNKFFKLHKLLKYSNFIYYFNLILLILVLIVGKEINGSKSWFDFKYFSFQPSELMKFSMALYLSNLLTKKDKFYFIKALLIFIFPTILVFLQPDTGAIIMYLIIFLSSSFYSLKNKKIFYIICFIFLFFTGIFIWLYFYNIDLLVKLLGTSIFYRIDRIISFKNNYQLQNALISIGSTNFFSRGNKAMLYIPESITDFMFARVISLYGFISFILLCICYFTILLYLISRIENNSNKNFTFCFFWLFLFQIFHNIFMNIGIFPIMGTPLPFLSYGGSNTIIYFLFFSLIIEPNKKNQLIK